MSFFRKLLAKKPEITDNTLVKNPIHLLDAELSNAEILFLRYLNGSDASADFPKYWSYTYQLNTKAAVKRMLDKNFIRLAEPHEFLHFYTGAELKEFLKAKGLKTSGKKDSLISNILQNSNTDEIKKAFKKPYYTLGDRGMPYMERADFLFFFHSYSSVLGIPIDSAQKIKDRYPEWNKYKVALYLLEKQLKDYAKSKDWGLYRNALFGISEVYGSAVDYNKQLEYLCMVCYRDLSGMGNNNSIDPKSSLILASGVIRKIANAQKKLQLSDDGLKGFYLGVISKMDLAHTYYSPEASWDKIKDELDSIE